MTGKVIIEKTRKESLNQFIDAGLNIDITLRPKNVQELRNLFTKIN